MTSSAQTYHIVRLDSIHTPDPAFSPTFPHTYTSYPTTSYAPAEVIARLTSPHAADAVITTTVPITAEILAACPRLKFVSVLGIGTNHVDLDACRERGIRVANVPNASNESVAEHAIAMYFSLRRNLGRLNEILRGGVEWPKKYTLKAEFDECPRTAREEVVGIIGGGELGNRVANICRALNMTVLLAERKGVPVASIRPSRVAFEKVLQTSTIIFLTLPLSASTTNTLSTEEFAQLNPSLTPLLINVSRGKIVDEPALIKALEEGKLSGAATDVFENEPAGNDNILVKKAGEWAEEWAKNGDGEGSARLHGRLLLTPHIAWYGKSSIERLRGVTKANIEGWAGGKMEEVQVVA